MKSAVPLTQNIFLNWTSPRSIFKIQNEFSEIFLVYKKFPLT